MFHPGPNGVENAGYPLIEIKVFSPKSLSYVTQQTKSPFIHQMNLMSLHTPTSHTAKPQQRDVSENHLLITHS